ncbi:alpha/beta fold hydrolase [Sphingopyxis sp. R3-92]|uniref:alpha/beta fold hydrolase n=1 Tax=Sphingopyxis sp. R3-92 TaxID=3158553 RepID=UPI003EE54653
MQADENHATFDTGDCLIHYWIGGPPGAPLVVLTPGAYTDHRMFDPQIEPLQAEYRTLRWDPRGHGRSRPASRPFSPQLAAENLIAILDAIGEKKAILIGQSIGGNISQELLFRYPERCAAAILIGCTCSTIAPRRWERWLLASFPFFVSLYPAETFKRKAMGDSASVQASCDKLRQMIAPLSRSDILYISRGIARAVHDEPDYSIEHPILIMNGAHDRLGNISRIVERWRERDRNSEYVEVADAGHVANLDNPGAVNAAILAFIRKHGCTR